MHEHQFGFVSNRFKGLYKKTLRIMVDLSNCYYLATQELICKEYVERLFRLKVHRVHWWQGDPLQIIATVCPRGGGTTWLQ